MCWQDWEINWDAIAAIATTAAVILALYISNRDRRDRVREQRENESKSRALQLLGLHQHLVICSKRIRDYWAMAPTGHLPSFRLPLVSYDNMVRSIPSLLSDPSAVQLVIKTIEEHAHLNAKFDDVLNRILELDKYNADRDTATRHGSISGSRSDDETKKKLENAVRQSHTSLDLAVPVVYSLNYNAMIALENELIDGQKLSQSYGLREGSHTEPRTLDRAVNSTT